MAKRKRLTPAEIKALEPGTERAPESKSMSGYPLGVQPVITRRPPIAQVAGDAATQAALDQVAGELQAARTEGRLVLSVPLDAVDGDHLMRDRMVSDADDMEVLKTSLKARGQQTPIEVVDLGQGRYGLISGWRRLTAFRQLLAETGETRFAGIQCLTRRPEGAAGAYLAMVEENEIRVGLSYYERARIAALAAGQGVYPTAQRAVKGLFASASRAKRSKIGAFLTVHAMLDEVLRFPSALPERLGLALSKAIQGGPDFAPGLVQVLKQAPAATPEAERAILQQALHPKAAPVPAPVDIVPGIRLETGRRWLVLSGDRVTPALTEDLKQWLAGRE